MKKYSLFFLLPALLLLGSCTAKTPEIFPPETVKAFSDAGIPLFSQKAAPRDFSLPLASGVPGSLARTISLGGLKGKVVFLNFWATWCGPCRVEMPSMEALYSKYKDRGFEILAVNSGEKAPEVLEFMASGGFSFPAVLDSEGTVSRIYGIQAIPTTYLIDRDGMILFRMTGSINWDTPQIHAALELLLD